MQRGPGVGIQALQLGENVFVLFLTRQADSFFLCGKMIP